MGFGHLKTITRYGKFNRRLIIVLGFLTFLLLNLGSLSITRGNNDLDDDGLSNMDENNLGTDPLNPDTDDDGLIDGDEVYIHFTDPLNPDCDNDDLSDGEEVNLYYTDPKNRMFVFHILFSRLFRRRSEKSDSVIIYLSLDI